MHQQCPTLQLQFYIECNEWQFGVYILMTFFIQFSSQIIPVGRKAPNTTIHVHIYNYQLSYEYTDL